MRYGTFKRHRLNDRIHHIVVGHHRALCSKGRVSTITHDAGVVPHAFMGGRLCRRCLRAWEAGVDGEEFDLESLDAERDACADDNEARS
jgi:hypothetical protein